MESLEAELQDLSSQESKDEASLAKVRKQLRDLEAKAKDQEEELDEQAGTIQMLEQVGRGGTSVPVLSFSGQGLALPVFWACWFHGGVSQASSSRLGCCCCCNSSLEARGEATSSASS